MINKELEITIEATVRDAEARRHEYLTVEHILFAILHDEWGIQIITSCGGSTSALKSSIEEFFDKNIPKLPAKLKEHPEPTIAFRRVFETPMTHIRSAEKQEADAGDILSAIFHEKESHAVHFLSLEGIERLDVLNYISHGIQKNVDDILEETPSETKAVPNKKHSH